MGLLYPEPEAIAAADALLEQLELALRDLVEDAWYDADAVAKVVEIARVLGVTWPA